MSYLKLLSVICSICFVMLGSFQLGAQYGGSPYRLLVMTNAPKHEFTQLGADQTHTLFIVACFATGLAALNLTLLVLWRMQEARNRVTA